MVRCAPSTSKRYQVHGDGTSTNLMAEEVGLMLDKNK
jgi:hypothetical protein